MSEYREIFEKIPDGVTLHDVEDGSIIDANQQFCEMLGYDRSELLKTDFEGIHADEPPYTTERAEEYIQRAATEGPQTFEWRDETNQGAVVPVEVHLRRTTIDDRECVLAVVRDITQRKERQRELERVREQMEFALEATDSFIWSLDLDTGTSVEYGPVERLFGTEPTGIEEFVEELVHPEDAGTVWQTYEAIRNGETAVFDLEFRTVPAEDTPTWISCRGYVWTDDDGVRRRLIGLATDVTDRERRQAELERQNERLEEFANVLSHDLRNPLSIARGELELAREERDSDRLETVDRAHDRIEELVENLLNLAKEGSAVGETEPVTLDHLARECWDLVESADATLLVETDRRIEAEPPRLRQLLENLFDNAVKHGGDGVTVVLGPVEGGFYVADDGPGIPASEREAVFETGHSSATGGTGLGLQIVRDVATAHGWEVRATESEDGGARFEVTGVTPAVG